VGRLIELALAEDVVFPLCGEQRDAWLRWQTKCASLIPAALGTDVGQAAAMLCEHVYEQLSELGELTSNFTGGVNRSSARTAEHLIFYRKFKR
jgi:hypothetical protein